MPTAAVPKEWRSLYDEAATTPEGKRAMQESLLDYYKCLGYSAATAAKIVVKATSTSASASASAVTHVDCEQETAALERSVLALERAYRQLAKIEECTIKVTGSAGGGSVITVPTLRLNPGKGVASLQLTEEEAKKLLSSSEASGAPVPPRRRRRASQQAI